MLLTPNVPRGLVTLWQTILKVVNYHISFGDGTNAENIDGSWLAVTFTVLPNFDQTFSHQLGRIPVGYLPMSKSDPADVYTGSVAATSTQITLRCTSSPVSMVLFLV